MEQALKLPPPPPTQLGSLLARFLSILKMIGLELYVNQESRFKLSNDKLLNKPALWFEVFLRPPRTWNHLCFVHIVLKHCLPLHVHEPIVSNEACFLVC